MLTNTKTSWGSVARLLHWTLAILIIGMLAFGYWMNHWSPRADRLFYRSIHADIGYIVLVVAMLRLSWRVFNPRPAWPMDTPQWERLAAGVGHAALYIMIFVVTLFGWAHAGAHKPDYASFFGLFRMPQFTSESRELSMLYEDRHVLMAYVLLVLVVIHVLAALWHHVIKRDRLLKRMVTGEG